MSALPPELRNALVAAIEEDLRNGTPREEALEELSRRFESKLGADRFAEANSVIDEALVAIASVVTPQVEVATRAAVAEALAPEPTPEPVPETVFVEVEAAAAVQEPEPPFVPIVQEPEDFFEREVERLRSLLNTKCAALFDLIGLGEIGATVDEWRENLEEDAKIFFEEDNTMSKLLIGTKVRGFGYGNPGTVVQYGIVSMNFLAYEKMEYPPFADLEARAVSDVANEKMAAAPEEAKQQVLVGAQTAEADRQARLKNLATLTYVIWYDQNGNQQCQGWHDSATLATLVAVEES